MKAEGFGKVKLPDRIVLTGPSGSGKSHLGSLIADAAGYELYDTDAAIEASIGMTIDEFFSRFGEPAFRAIETSTLREACSGSSRVISTGGGVVLAEENWAYLRPRSIILGLTASVDTLVERVQRQQDRLGRTAARPKMAGDPHASMSAMLATRDPYYARADVVIDTDRRSVDEVFDIAMETIRERAERKLIPAVSIETPVERSDLYVARGVRRELPELIGNRWPRASRLWIISDENVASHWLAEMLAVLSSTGFDVREVVIPAGESSKSLKQLGGVLEEMTGSGVSRTDVVIALGGGVVGDLGGLVAAICLRGLSLVQLPTSLLAMVDSSVGGKTGVNTTAGKNMVGAFYQPGLVLIDPDFLDTLSRAEYRSGMAEVIKHSAIQGSTPLQRTTLDAALAQLPSIDPIPANRIDAVVLENVLTKYSVVQEDERESGLRMILNFGHTAGHAIEAEGYRYRHGEAVALGMLVATHIAISLDLCDAGRFATIEARLSQAGLPTRFDGEVEAVLSNMKADKKNIAGVQRWILPVGDRGVEVRTGVDSDLVAAALSAIGGR